MGFSKSDSESASQTGSEVWDVQAPYLEQLYQSGGELLGQQSDIFGDASKLSDEFLQSMRGSLGTLGSLAAGQTQGQEYLAGSLGTENPYLQETIDALGADIEEFTRETVGTDIAGTAAGTGGAFGSSRHGLVEAEAIESGQEEFASASSALRYQDYADQLARAESLTESQYQGAVGQGQIAPGAYDLGLAPYSAAWLPQTSYAMTLGAPTSLQFGQSTGDSSSLGLTL